MDCFYLSFNLLADQRRKSDIPCPRKCCFLGTRGLAKGSRTSEGALESTLSRGGPSCKELWLSSPHRGKFLMHLRGVTFTEKTVLTGKLFQKELTG